MKGKSQSEYELINKTRHEITIVNENDEVIKEMEAADEPCEVVYESEKLEDLKVDDESVDLMARTDKRTKNLPERPKSRETIEKLYIVSFVVREANPDRVDFISPTDYVRDDENRVIGCRRFNSHPDLRRDEDERHYYPRWVECPNCGGNATTRRWKGNFKRTKDRMMVQLFENSESGVKDFLTVQMPSISKEVDLFIRNGELKLLESEIGNDEDLKADVIEG